MIRVRRVEDVAVVDWTQKDVAALVPRLRSLVEAREAPHALLNMSEVETLKGDGLETLTEALSVCEDGACVLGMYGLNTYVAKLLEIMGLENVMPSLLGATEAEALVRVRTLRPSARGRSVPAGVSGRTGTDLGIAEVEIEFEPQDTSAQASRPIPATPAGARDEVVLEFDMDAPPVAKPAARAAAPPAPAPGQHPGKPPSLAATLRFDKSAVGAIRDEPDEMLAISWADLVSQGIPIGGPGARDLATRAAAEAGNGAPGADLERGVPKPTTRFPANARPTTELEIDLEPSSPKRAFKTEVISTFTLSPDDIQPAPTAEKASKAPTAGDGFRGDETRTDHSAVEAPELEVDFEPARADEVGFGPDTLGLHVGQLPQNDSLFGEAEPDASGWSPVDTDTEVRRPAALDATPPSVDRTQTPPRPLPARPAPPPTPAQPVRPLPAPAQPIGRAPTPPQPTPLTRPATRPVASPPTPAAQAPVAPPTPVAPPAHVAPAAPAPAPAAEYYGGDGGDETVMFQPDGFLAEVLAAVSPTVQPEAAAPGGRAGDTSLDLEVKSSTPPPTQQPAPPPAAAPAPAPAAPATADAREDLRKFLIDYAVVSELHLRVLERFSREGVDKIIGRPDIQAAVGGSAAAVASIIEDFVQARLLRRRRSPRVRGGTGFIYSPSPKTRNSVTRLLRLYEDGAARGEVLGWVQAARQAAGT